MQGIPRKEPCPGLDRSEGRRIHPNLGLLLGYWGHCRGGNRGFEKKANREGFPSERTHEGSLQGWFFSSGIEMSENSPTTKELDLSDEEIRLILASIDETIDALNDWEFPARTGFERGDFESLRRKLHMHSRRYL